LREDLALDGLVLDDGFDHQLTVGEVAQARGECQPAKRGVAIALAQLALARRALQRSGEALAGRLGQLLGRLEDDHVRAGLRRYLGDPRAHLAAADDTYPFNSHGDTFYSTGELGPHRR
jgi:hypothetical protein